MSHAEMEHDQSRTESRDDVSVLATAVEVTLREKNKDLAVWSIFELIADYARRGDFVKAELLREKLVQFDPMALTEIIASAELIEEAKTRARPREHLRIWADLHARLTPEESNTLYYSMKERRTFGIEPLFRQGERNTNLYFLNEGRLIMFWNHRGRETAVKTFHPGSIIGEDTFFGDSICTSSVRTFSHASCNYLEQGVLVAWREQFPALEWKLKEYCKEFRKGPVPSEESKLDRRCEPRYRVSGQGMIHLLYDSGQPIDPAFKGELLNLSAAGLCFSVRIPRRDTVRLLLGRRINLKFIVNTGKSPLSIDRRGSVVAVQPMMLNDYTVHVELDHPLSTETISELEASGNAEENPPAESETSGRVTLV
jgi:hypothetical protein